MSILVKRFTAPMPGGDKTVRVFVPGVVVSVVQVMDGSMILGVQESRIAVNEDLARRIMVEAA